MLWICAQQDYVIAVPLRLGAVWTCCGFAVDMLRLNWAKHHACQAAPATEDGHATEQFVRSKYRQPLSFPSGARGLAEMSEQQMSERQIWDLRQRCLHRSYWRPGADSSRRNQSTAAAEGYGLPRDCPLNRRNGAKTKLRKKAAASFARSVSTAEIS
jgi:hypothetical protein